MAIREVKRPKDAPETGRASMPPPIQVPAMRKLAEIILIRG